MEPALAGLALVVAASALTIGAILLSRGGREVPVSPAVPIDQPATTESAAPAPTVVPASEAPAIAPEVSLPPAVPAGETVAPVPTLAPRTSLQPPRPTPAAPGAPYKDYSTDPGGGEKLPGQ
jgi:serine/threonine-protein kinase